MHIINAMDTKKSHNNLTTFLNYHANFNLIFLNVWNPNLKML